MQKILLDTDIGGDIDDAVCLPAARAAVRAARRHDGVRGIGKAGGRGAGVLAAPVV